MNNLDFTGLSSAVAEKLSPMVTDLVREHGPNIHSYYVTGSAVVPDYNEKLSDVNSVVVLKTMDLKFVEFLAPLGGKYGKKRIAAPLVMTPEYITGSLDAFPVEFLDFKLIHKTVFGEDLFKDLQLTARDLRLQCEREVKSKLIHLRQGYIASLGEKKPLTEVLVRSITGSMPVFRAIIFVLGAEPPIVRQDVLKAFGAAAHIDTGVFEELLALKAGLIRPSEQELHTLFERYYHALDGAGAIIDGCHA
jgi:hypothetical protein